MRWVLAGLAFAALVGVAIATTSVRAHNVKSRARLRSIQQDLEVYSIERQRREHALECETTPERLVARWRFLDELREIE